ncbi:hypothetical protein BDQ12DRAFT_614424 [Crucibulum laeve]|uniref:Uncharacterized protein n=1 Tax=Crucibulum laeve TaxID=68775 RepID=A0A5C3LYT3_9AGAR|nr:hypothetical protein BDQ12DRAFT_614424 [Crucibulum laeve]
MHEGTEVGPRTGGRLEVEDKEDRQRRIQAALEKLNKSSATTTTTTQSGPPKFDFGDRTTFRVPPTELLERAQAFLPQIEASNAALAEKMRRDPHSVDIEHLDEENAQYIEMSLGLGVYEDRSQAKSGGSGTESSSDSSSDSDSSDEEMDGKTSE